MKRIADAKSKGGAAAASADDGDVAAVMEVDDVVMRTGDDPIYGTKDVLFRRLCEYEQIAAKEEQGREVSGIEEEGVGGGYRTGDTKDPPWSNSTL